MRTRSRITLPRRPAAIIESVGTMTEFPSDLARSVYEDDPHAGEELSARASAFTEALLRARRFDRDGIDDRRTCRRTPPISGGFMMARAQRGTTDAHRNKFGSSRTTSSYSLSTLRLSLCAPWFHPCCG